MAYPQCGRAQFLDSLVSGIAGSADSRHVVVSASLGGFVDRQFAYLGEIRLGQRQLDVALDDRCHPVSALPDQPRHDARQATGEAMMRAGQAMIESENSGRNVTCTRTSPSTVNCSEW